MSLFKGFPEIPANSTREDAGILGPVTRREENLKHRFMLRETENGDVYGVIPSPPAPCRTVPLATLILRTEGRISIHVSWNPPYLGLPKGLRPHEQPAPAVICDSGILGRPRAQRC